jgi:hypothetical protein
MKVINNNGIHRLASNDSVLDAACLMTKEDLEGPQKEAKPN